ncbi:2OG-Fe(II) oxygenase [Kushneria phyllosphaerae]|uniref:Prolyl 4-hydroxylase alpha subunit Fe(2+) 2OG dioxygenase domain-containing protein n=1 Tax=Kushneria phyllosphaerae TaxID=2100822 RepID=A0A2R8CIR5_9GAMM|nr:2OG-Fe(II) oxygenase [Kushneria phyllosphaerae]SPJ32789.1 hypothetical protein KSP9073_00790 [Kushneria phyllosphaerae]
MQKLRQEVIDATANFMFSEKLSNAVEKIKSEKAAAVALPNALPLPIVEYVKNELKSSDKWRKEYWVLDDDESVSLVDKKVFYQTSPSKRFSNNQTLRTVTKEQQALSAFLSTLHDKKIAEYLSNLYDEEVEACASDIAKYSKGQYLRRHSDLFENRRFGIIFFFNDEWKEGNGNEFIVEGKSGDAYVVPPKPGDAVILNIQPGFQHQVAMSQSDEWIRYSVATHYKNKS